jgi:uncharacterized SAM-binding protein YcdF (DUF218 family)
MRRTEVAFTQALAHPQSSVLVMGAAVANDSVESETMCSDLHRRGLPQDRLIPERETTTTREQVRLLARLVRQHRPNNLILVSDASHLPRIRMMLSRAKLSGLTVTHAGTPWPRGFSGWLNDLVYESVAWSKDFFATWRGI